MLQLEKQSIAASLTGFSIYCDCIFEYFCKLETLVMTLCHIHFIHVHTCSEKHGGLESSGPQIEQLHSDSHPYVSQAPSVY